MWNSCLFDKPSTSHRGVVADTSLHSWNRFFQTFISSVIRCSSWPPMLAYPLHRIENICKHNHSIPNTGWVVTVVTQFLTRGWTIQIRTYFTHRKLPAVGPNLSSSSAESADLRVIVFHRYGWSLTIYTFGRSSTFEGPCAGSSSWLPMSPVSWKGFVRAGQRCPQ